MRLTVYTDYSLRMLMYLAIKGNALSTIAEVASAYSVSKAHLGKVAHQLSLAGYVETVRGQGGGLRLATSAENISLGAVIRRMEPDMALVPCFEPVRGACPIVPACGLKHVLHEAKHAFLAVTDGYTIAQLIAQRTELGELLQISIL